MSIGKEVFSLHGLTFVVPEFEPLDNPLTEEMAKEKILDPTLDVVCADDTTQQEDIEDLRKRSYSQFSAPIGTSVFKKADVEAKHGRKCSAIEGNFPADITSWLVHENRGVSGESTEETSDPNALTVTQSAPPTEA